MGDKLNKEFARVIGMKGSEPSINNIDVPLIKDLFKRSPEPISNKNHNTIFQLCEGQIIFDENKCIDEDEEKSSKR